MKIGQVLVDALIRDLRRGRAAMRPCRRPLFG